MAIIVLIALAALLALALVAAVRTAEPARIPVRITPPQRRPRRHP